MVRIGPLKLWLSWGLTLAFILSAAYANPQGGEVVSGSAVISSPNRSTTLIQQSTGNVIIDWTSFGIGTGEVTQFLQPSSTSVALNRVTGLDPSLIMGTLKANGRIFLINPNGILFGPGAEVDVGGLVASTLSISDRDFLAGNFAFVEGDLHPLSAVVNEGSLKAESGGFVVLLAPLVDNEGTIVASLGRVGLGGGTAAVLNFDGTGFVNFVLQKTGAAFPRNVVMSPQALSGTLEQVVNDRQIVEAGSVLRQGGEVFLTGASGLVLNAGTIDVSPPADLSGVSAGSVAVEATSVTVLTPGSVISANGGGINSNGGSVLVDSMGKTFFQTGAAIDARGGATGNGGHVEVSDADGGEVAGVLDLSAPNGALGTLLIDPSYGGNIEITKYATSAPSDSPLETPDADTATTFVSVTNITGATTTVSAPNIEIDQKTSINMAAGASLTLVSTTGDITFESGSKIITTGAGNISLCAGAPSCGGSAAAGAGNINIGNAYIGSANGNITLTANNNIVSSGGTTESSGSGNVSLTAGNNLTVSGGSTASVNSFGPAGNVSMTATSGALYIKSEFVGSQSDNGISGTVTLSSGGAMTINGDSVESYASNTAVGGAAQSAFVSLNAGGAIKITTSSLVESYADTSGGGNARSANISLVAGGSLSLSGSTAQSKAQSTSGAGTAASGGITLNSKAGFMYLNNATVSSYAHSLSSVSNGNLTLTSGGNFLFYKSRIADKNKIGAGAVVPAGSVSLSSNGAILTKPGVSYFIEAGATTLTATGGIGSAANPLQLDTGSINLTAGGAGSFIVNTGALLSPLSVSTNNSDVSIVSGASTLSFTASTGLLNANLPGINLTFDNTGGNLAPGVITVGSANTVTLTSAGNIEGGTITAATLNLTAGTDIGATTAVGMGGGILNAAAKAGNLHVTSAGSLTVGTVSSSGSTTLSTSSGDILLDGITAGGGVFLTAFGNILNVAPTGTTDVIANGSATFTAGGVIGTVSAPVTVSITGGNLAVSASTALSGVSVDINGTISPSNTLSVLGAPPGQVILNGITLFPLPAATPSSSFPATSPSSSGFSQQLPNPLSQTNPYISNASDFSTPFLIVPIGENWFPVLSEFIRIDLPFTYGITVEECAP